MSDDQTFAQTNQGMSATACGAPEQQQAESSAAPAVAEVETEPNEQRGQAHYDQFYRQGGWKYTFWAEFWWLRRNLVRRFNLERGAQILEVGCGAGYQTHVLNKMGFRCIGVDRSAAGIEWAREHYPKGTYYCCDAMGEMPFDRNSFDCVFARGLSNYHYDLLTEQALRTTSRMMEYLKPGGVFVMSIATNLSGSRDPGQIWHNRLEDYERHFASFSGPWSVDYHKGMVVCGLWNEQAVVEGGHPDQPTP
jgi:SAM-dependent methyltransferase